MPDVDRIPVLVFDDGTPDAAVTMRRALRVASRIVYGVTPNSPNHTTNIAAADAAQIPVVVEPLSDHSDVRDALALCPDHGIYVAYVTHPGEHTGVLLRNVIQACARDEYARLPVLAVHIVHPDAPDTGPVVELDPAHSDAGFAALFAAGLAASLHTPLHILRLTGDRADSDLRAADALHRARQLITDQNLAVYHHDTNRQPFDAAVHYAHGAYAVVMGLGGFAVSGHKLTHPSQLPNRVLDTPDGQLAHHLTRHAPTDTVVVLDAIDHHHSPAAQAAALTAALGAITAGTVAAGPLGFAATTAGVAAAATAYRATRPDA